MKRLHLFEFEDLSWFPSLFRKHITALLTHQILKFGVYDPVIPKLVSLAEKTKSEGIVDLCSGDGGAVLGLDQILNKKRKKKILITLTDKFPNKGIFEKLKGLGNIQPIFFPVDATDVPGSLKGIRTLFTAFHHFKPNEAQKILESAMRQGESISIFEITKRNYGAFLTLLIAPLACLYFTLFTRPLTFSKIFWTYCIPVLPIIYTWDALTVAKLKEMSALADPHGKYVWESGELKSKFHVELTYLIGYQKEQSHTC